MRHLPIVHEIYVLGVSEVLNARVTLGLCTHLNCKLLKSFYSNSIKSCVNHERSERETKTIWIELTNQSNTQFNSLRTSFMKAFIIWICKSTIQRKKLKWNWGFEQLSLFGFYGVVWGQVMGSQYLDVRSQDPLSYIIFLLENDLPNWNPRKRFAKLKSFQDNNYILHMTPYQFPISKGKRHSSKALWSAADLLWGISYLYPNTLRFCVRRQFSHQAAHH